MKKSVKFTQQHQSQQATELLAQLLVTTAVHHVYRNKTTLRHCMPIKNK